MISRIQISSFDSLREIKIIYPSSSREEWTSLVKQIHGLKKDFEKRIKGVTQ